MDAERDQLHNRLTNKHRSHATEIAWKRHHGDYMRGVRERERNCMNKTFYGVAKELESKLTEATLEKDNIFELDAIISFDNVAGAISFNVDRDNHLFNISTSLQNSGTGCYKSSTQLDDNALQQLYRDFKDELKELCNTFDDELKQLLAKHGLNPTQ